MHAPFQLLWRFPRTAFNSCPQVPNCFFLYLSKQAKKKGRDKTPTHRKKTPHHLTFFTNPPVYCCVLLPLPTTVTPLPDLTRLLSAASFCCFAFPLFDRDVLVLAYRSAVLANASRIFCFAFLSLVRRARFSAGVSSLRARTSVEDVGTKTSSGASVLASDRPEGSADSRDAAGTFDTVVILAFGCQPHP